MTTITEQHLVTTWRIAGAASIAWRQPSRWIDRRKQRQDLSELDDHLLADIGLTRAAAAREWSKPFWRR